MRKPKIIKFKSKEVVKNVKKKRFDILTFVIVGVAIILSVIATCYTSFKMYEIKNGKSVDDIGKYIGKSDDIFNLENYYADTEVTVVSNKNTNTYNIKQYYSNKNNCIKARTEFKDSTSGNITVIFNGSNMQLKSNSQKSVYLLENYELNNLNYLDIEGVITKYKKIEAGEIKGKVNKFEKNDELKIIIEYDKEDNWYKGKIKESEIIIDTKTKKVLNLVHYDNNKKIVCNIKYNEFKINKGVDEKLFNF